MGGEGGRGRGGVWKVSLILLGEELIGPGAPLKFSFSPQSAPEQTALPLKLPPIQLRGGPSCEAPSRPALRSRRGRPSVCVRDRRRRLFPLDAHGAGSSPNQPPEGGRCGAWRPAPAGPAGRR